MLHYQYGCFQHTNKKKSYLFLSKIIKITIINYNYNQKINYLYNFLCIT